LQQSNSVRCSAAHAPGSFPFDIAHRLFALKRVFNWGLGRTSPGSQNRRRPIMIT
jgi:hypothetical protein